MQVYPRVQVPKETWYQLEDDGVLEAIQNAVLREWLQSATMNRKGLSADQIVYESGRLQGLQDALRAIEAEKDRKEAVPDTPV